MSYAIVLVEWRDAYSWGHWSEITEVPIDPVIVNSVGFLLPDAKDGYLVIAQSDDMQGSFDNYLYIPVGMVERIQVVSDVRGTSAASA
jgi:hypothetical protein